MSRNVIGRSSSGRPVRSNLKPGRKATRTLNQHKQRFTTSAQRNHTKIRFVRQAPKRPPKPIRTIRAQKTPHAAIRRSDWRRGAVRSGKTGQVVRIGKFQHKASNSLRMSRRF